MNLSATILFLSLSLSLTLCGYPWLSIIKKLELISDQGDFQVAKSRQSSVMIPFQITLLAVCVHESFQVNFYLKNVFHE